MDDKSNLSYEADTKELESKKEWHVPQIVDLEMENTENGTFGNEDGGPGWYNLS